MKRLLAFAFCGLLVSGCAAKKHSMPTPEQMQKNMMEAGMVRPEHALLKKLAGDWKVDVKMWMDPNSEPEVSKGRAYSKPLYGGRYLAQTYKGTFMGKPFEGQGTMGYDNTSGKYFSTWIDSMSTMLMKSEGKATGDNTIVLASAMTCPTTKEYMENEELITIIDNNHYRYEVFNNLGGSRNKAMEINYSRVK